MRIYAKQKNLIHHEEEKTLIAIIKTKKFGSNLNRKKNLIKRAITGKTALPAANFKYGSIRVGSYSTSLNF